MLCENLKSLIRDLTRIPHMMLVIDSYSAVSEMHVDSNTKLDFGCRWATLESDLWHVHLDMESVTSIQFAETLDQFHERILKL